MHFKYLNSIQPQIKKTVYNAKGKGQPILVAEYAGHLFPYHDTLYSLCYVRNLDELPQSYLNISKQRLLSEVVKHASKPTTGKYNGKSANSLRLVKETHEMGYFVDYRPTFGPRTNHHYEVKPVLGRLDSEQRQRKPTVDSVLRNSSSFYSWRTLSATSSATLILPTVRLHTGSHTSTTPTRRCWWRTRSQGSRRDS